jgi:hypothetical protein
MATMMSYEPLHHTIVATDVVGSGTRDDQQLLRMRADLQAILTFVLSRQSLDFAAIHHDDLGDGIRLVVPAAVTPRAMLDPFIPNLAAALREHRKLAAVASRIRLRVAVHTGLLHHDSGAWAGEPMVHCTRLLDAALVRRTAQLNPDADLTVVVSQTVYDSVVRHGYGLDAAACHEVPISEKETRTRAWLHLPGCRQPVWPDVTQAPESGTPGTPIETPPPAVPVRTQYNTAYNDGVVYAVQDGEQHIHHYPGTAGG